MVNDSFGLPALKDINSNLISNDEQENEIFESELKSALEDDDFIDLSHLDSKLYGKPDNVTTKDNLENFDINDKVNPEELGTYLEGDILMPPPSSRNGMISRAFRWPKGIIPYEIRGSFTAAELALIKHGLNEYHKKTCIRFKPRTNEKDYISIVNSPSGCWSSIGRIGGRQDVNVQTPGCFVRGSGTFVHELMHAVGFLHEQTRHERDNYITIQYNNINKSFLHNFDKTSPSQANAFGTPYDYGSIMHYSAYAFSSNGQPTIIPKQKVSVMGQRNGFSEYDVMKINLMYKCSRRQRR
ncbi:hatching enzyme 1.2-like [Condylostylus longicornis]|uniref:hatching enzyme 1.2-like n=1 Tax=Condylostylus longicornis TaxID=2530218 RepID=UPI00244DB0DE|nr:hatching enzyme 1.2-like [Condylostylus longicornis]